MFTADIRFSKASHRVSVRCWSCDQWHHIYGVRADAIRSWRAGALIQDSLGYLTDGERELLISGTCSDCFDQMCAPDDDIDQEGND